MPPIRFLVLSRVNCSDKSDRCARSYSPDDTHLDSAFDAGDDVRLAAPSADDASFDVSEEEESDCHDSNAIIERH